MMDYLHDPDGPALRARKNIQKSSEQKQKPCGRLEMLLQSASTDSTFTSLIHNKIKNFILEHLVYHIGNKS